MADHWVGRRSGFVLIPLSAVIGTLRSAFCLARGLGPYLIGLSLLGWYVCFISYIGIVHRLCRKMFIGGLNWETDDSEQLAFPSFFPWLQQLKPSRSRPIDSLQGYFSQFGRVASSSIMRDPTGRSRGFAFLTFEDPASVNAVMAKEHVLDGKIVSSSCLFFPWFS